MTIEEIKNWKCSDDTTFTSESKAILTLSKYIDENPIYQLRSCHRVDGLDFIKWLEENPRIHIKLKPLL